MPFVLGVTGGIASGKTTVANMLEELGAPMIDFDVVARQVVEPGTEAWREIVDTFGKEVLQKDGNLDRKRLSGIVFQDEDKRRRLEQITHPRIVDKFFYRANEIAEEHPDSIIQAVIPLLFEVNLRYVVDKVLLVYVPRHKQIERLLRRDNISREEAARILDAQLAIDEKARRADFVIHNEGSLDETKEQVVELWEKLRHIQNEKMRGANQ